MIIKKKIDVKCPDCFSDMINYYSLEAGFSLNACSSTTCIRHTTLTEAKKDEAKYIGSE